MLHHYVQDVSEKRVPGPVHRNRFSAYPFPIFSLSISTELSREFEHALASLHIMLKSNHHSSSSSSSRTDELLWKCHTCVIGEREGDIVGESCFPRLRRCSEPGESVRGLMGAGRLLGEVAMPPAGGLLSEESRKEEWMEGLLREVDRPKNK